jgi:RimJ/RimL family protein N-acetyltransferase
MIETERLRMRHWRSRDTAPLFSMCSDPRVMRFLGPHLRMTEVVQLIERQIALQKALGHCFWALELAESGEFIGWCGLVRGPFATPISNKLEIGWRLAHRHWRNGYATEAARAVLDWAWANTGDPAVWAITARDNVKSSRVMTRIGMRRRSELEFDHPALVEGDPLRRHITAVIDRPKIEGPEFTG